MPLAAAAAIGAGGSIFGGLMGSHASHQAAQAQAQTAQQALDFQRQQWATTQAQQQPFLQAGQRAVTNLSALTSPGGALMQPWTKPFVAPTGATEMNDPGYQFRLQQGMQALQRSAAAQGNLMTGGTMKDLTNYAQNYASNEYGNVYNRALGQYQQAYDIFQNNQANQFNRLRSMAGLGQQTVSDLGRLGLGTASAMGQAAQAGGAARATGYLGSANALAGGFGGAMSDVSGALMMKYMQDQGQTSGGLGRSPVSGMNLDQYNQMLTDWAGNQ